MQRFRSLGLWLLAFTIAVPGVALAPVSTQAQDDLPVSIAAAGLTNPRGMTWDADGALVVAEAGTGGNNQVEGEATVPEPTGPYTGGLTAAVSRVGAERCPAVIAEGLPSALSATGEPIGAAAVAYLGEALYVLVSGGGEAHGNPEQPNGVYAVAEDGTAELLVDLGQWVRNNPVAQVPEADFDPEGVFFAMVADPAGDALWVVESNSEQVLSVTADGEVARVADLSETDMVPTAIVPAPEGGVYVGFLTGAPFPEGAAKVVKIDPQGNVSDVWTGLTMVTGIALDEEGVLYATQLSESRDRAPFLTPGTGSLVRQSGPDSAEEFANGLNLPVGLATGPDGAFYVSGPAVGADQGAGLILRIEPGAEPIRVNTAALEAPACGAAFAPGEGTPQGVPSADVQEIIIKIEDFQFTPSSLTVPVGSTVTWVNTGAVEHTTVSRVDGEVVWDSDILAPGETFAFTFEEAGVWEYVCGLHPSMTGDDRGRIGRARRSRRAHGCVPGCDDTQRSR